MQDTYYNDSTLTEYNISEIPGCHVSNLLYFRKCYHFASFCYLEDFFFITWSLMWNRILFF